MFGKNQVRGLETRTDGMLQVHEIFPTIQGEGPWSGYPAIFVRLSGCNLRCFFCDTKWDDKNDKWMSVRDMCRQIGIAGDFQNHKDFEKRVVLTGGEPARQDCGALIDQLTRLGYDVQIETAGTYWTEWLQDVTVVISPKTKHVHNKFYERDPSFAHWKYVIRADDVDPKDGLPGKTTQLMDPDTPTSLLPDLGKELQIIQEKYGVPARPPKGAKVWLSPCNEYDEEKNLRNRLMVGQLCMKHGYRAQVQLHMYLNLP
jgi:7-carboxy-7-deazaguanine synthase